MSDEPNLQVFDTSDQLAIAAAELFVGCASDSQRESNRFCVALSGGKTPKQVYELLATDDFRLTDVDGKIKSKNQVLAEVKEEKNIRSFDIVDDNLVSLEGSTAVLTYTLKVFGKNGRSAKAGTTDTFVQQDGKWLLKSEQQTLLR